MKFFNPLITSCILMFCFQSSIGQDSLWKRYNITKYISVLMPKNSITVDTFLIKENKKISIVGIKATTSDGIYVVTTFPNTVNVDIEDSGNIEEAIKGMKYGFLQRSKQQGIDAKAFDTILSGIPAIKGIVYNSDKIHMYNYMFMLYDKGFSIVFSPSYKNNNAFNQNMQSILGSLRLNKIKQSSSAIKTSEPDIFDKSYAMGRIFGTLIMLGVLICIIIYIVKKTSTN